MTIGSKIKNLRVQKNLTQEELGERTDLSKGYISQLERDLSSPSMETFFSLLDVLGVTPKEFFDEKEQAQQVIYKKEDYTVSLSDEQDYEVQWLISDSNENEMEPILLTLNKEGEYKTFQPSLSETFAFVLEGEVCVEIGTDKYYARSGESIYYKAFKEHHIKNNQKSRSRLLLVATNSYL